MDEDRLAKLQTKIVDTSEPREIQEVLLEVGWIRSKLNLADYSFFNHEFKKIGIERKSIEDFSTSIGDRLSGQLEACLDFYDETILLIEGSWSHILCNEEFIVDHQGNTSWRIINNEYLTTNKKLVWKKYWNYLRQRQRSGVTIELTSNWEHTVERVNELYALYQQPFSDSGKTKRFDDDRILCFPSGTRGATAQAALDIFGSILNVCNASVEELLMVPGIGKKKAERIYEHLHKNTEKSNQLVEYKSSSKFKEDVLEQQGKLV